MEQSHLAQEASIKTENSEIQPLSRSVLPLGLIHVQSGSWTLIFRHEPDLVVHDEPYFALNLLYHSQSGQYIWRVLGRTIEKGVLGQDQTLAGKCRQLFQDQSPCLGTRSKDERFPLSCKFSAKCSITLDSDDAKLGVCLECQKSIRPAKGRKRPELVEDEEFKFEDFDPAFKVEVEEEDRGDDLEGFEPLAEEIESRPKKRTRKGKASTEMAAQRQPWTCGLCHKVLSAGASVAHMRNVHLAGDFSCTLCFEPFQFASELSDHNILLHTANPSLDCPHCSTSIDVGDEKDGLMRHYEFCIKTKGQENGTKAKVQHPGQIHQCDQCGKEFSTSYLLKSHQKTHSNHWLHCQTCDFKTKYKQNLANHERRHVQGRGSIKNCICDLCGKALRGPECLDKHIKSIHEKSLHFPCDRCDRAFTSAAMLRRHKNRFHAESDEFICKLCNYRAGDHIELGDHMKVHEDPTHKCQYCSKLFRRKHHLTIHERIHKGEKPFKCDICDYASNNSGNLIKHKKFVHQQQKKTQKKPLPPQLGMAGPTDNSANHEGCTKQLTKSTVECFMCLACQEMAQPPLELKDEDDSLVRDQIDTILTDFNEATEVETNHRHKVRRLGKYDRRSCSLCGASLKSLSSLSSHMTLVHFRAYFNCIHCESKYRFANDLTEHILDEHPETPNAECPKCAKIVHLVDDLALSDHHQVCVRGKNRTKVSQNRINRVRADRPHQCDKCGKSYTLIEYLKNHKKKHGQHFKCTQCDFSTTSNQYLKEHEQKHLVQAGLAPKAVCHLCGKELSQNTSLKNHIKFVHSPLNFPCDKCERVFSREKTLTAHKNRVHGESDAFLCGECGHRAGSQMELRDHTRTHDSVLHKCRFCGKLLKSKRTLQNHERLHKNPTGGSADGPEGSNS
eukprot:maker-scaffold175_size286436-snap-gene-1.44 protein:Tk09294 transcript:maker-scaffold175_size286436-snap-gene-1.44-mRNA-1 annotation:"zinc finger protein 850-like"